MRALYRVVCGLLLAVAVGAVCAQEVTLSGDIPSESLTLQVIKQAMAGVTEKLVAQSIQWLSGFMALQFLFTNIKQLTQGDMEGMWAKFIGSLIWFGACWWVIGNAPDILNRVGKQFFQMYGPGFPSVSAIIATTIGIGTAATVAAVSAGGTIVGGTAGQAVLYFAIAFVGIGMFFAVKLFLLQLELALVVMLAPFSFSFLGLNAMRDQGLAPIKSVVALLYRTVIYGIVYSAYGQVANAIWRVLEQMSGVEGFWKSVTNIGGVFELVWAGLIAYILLFGLLFKSDAIAASLSSGSTSLGTADVAGAAMAGAAAGAMAGSAANAVAGTSRATGMSDWIQKHMGGGDVGMSNVSAMGRPDLGSTVAKPEVSNSMGQSTGAASAKSGATTQGQGGDTGKTKAYGGGPQSGPRGAGGQGAVGQSDAGGPSGAPAEPPKPGEFSAGEFGGTPNSLPGSGPTEAGAANNAAESGKPTPSGVGAAPRLSLADGGDGNVNGGTLPAPAQAGERFGGGATAKPNAAPAQTTTSAPASSTSAAGSTSGSGAADTPIERVSGGGAAEPVTPSEPANQAAAEARRQERQGSGTTAGIEGNNGELAQRVADLTDALANPKKKALADHVDDWHRQVAQEKHTVSVSINPHHD